jgi:hypothetical protein
LDVGVNRGSFGVEMLVCESGHHQWYGKKGSAAEEWDREGETVQGVP